MSKNKTKFICTDCGTESPKWMGKCPGCKEWNTMIEDIEIVAKNSSFKSAKTVQQNKRLAYSLNEIDESFMEATFTSTSKEFDRVLGNGITVGGVIMMGGIPGFGKSTLLSFISAGVSKLHRVLYISGEESVFQMKKRFSSRMKIEGNDNLKVMYANNVENIEETALEFKPKLIIIDSINTMGSAEISGDPGGTSQMKHSSARLINLAKENGFSIILVAQVNKDEAIAGPKSIEHMVDTVLYLEGEKHSELRLLRSTKNRFGSDNEVGVFKMVEDGLIEIENPSEYLLENRSMSVPGSAIACVSDTRPLLIEVQALVSAQSFENSNPRRTSEGFSRNRLLMIIAILEKHLGLKNLASRDVFLNVVGGITIREPGTDLGVAMSVYSSASDFALPNDTVFIGELGLAGEVRPINKIEQLIKEAERVGFKNIYIPAASAKVLTKKAKGITIIPVKHISELKKKTK